MKTVYVTRGVSASGKTTWAKQFIADQRADPDANDITIISRDDIRWDIMRRRGLFPCWKNWKWKDEHLVNKKRQELIERAIRNGTDVILCDTNLDDSVQKDVNLFLDAGYKYHLRVFHVTWEEALRRDNERPNGVGVSVISRQFQKMYREERPDESNLPKAIIVDVDGTLAHNTSNRGFFEWDRVGEDELDAAVKSAIEGFVDTKVFIFSGRDSVCRKETEDWLRKHNVSYDQLVMRQEGDNRKDTIVKREMFDDHISGKYQVVAVFDDRPSVCRMWRELGLKVFQLGNPYIEF